MELHSDSEDSVSVSSKSYSEISVKPEFNSKILNELAELYPDSEVPVSSDSNSKILNKLESNSKILNEFESDSEASI